MDTVLGAAGLRRLAIASATLVIGLLPRAVPAQDQLRTWGAGYAIDTDLFSVPALDVSVSACTILAMIVTPDGHIAALGDNSQMQSQPPLPPVGLRYTRVSASGQPLAELSNGQLVQWTPFLGSSPSPPPVLPAGMTWVQFTSTRSRAFALRSDGVLLSWGTTYGGLDLVPVLAPGLTYRSVATSLYWAAALVSDGSVRIWGQTNAMHPTLQTVPTLPAGVTFVQLCAGNSYLAALRSDGQIDAWGDNTYGQCNVPVLPPGMTYVDVITGGAHCMAKRSDGQWLAWGANVYGETTLPGNATATFVRLYGGDSFTLGVRMDGRIEAWGVYETPTALTGTVRYSGVDAIYVSGAFVVRTDGVIEKVLSPAFWPSAPSLAPGLRYTTISQGFDFTVATVSDGTVRAWGQNFFGQLAVPALPPGVTYVSADAGSQSAVALRSDGTAVAWGDNWWGQNNIPPLPAGLSYIAASAGAQNVLLLRSDGSITMTGTGGSGIVGLPSIPAGLRYTAVACGQQIAAAIRSDGTISSWGSGIVTVPALPPGVRYVEVQCGDRHAIARRSDGVTVTWGVPGVATPVPELPSGRSYLRLGAEMDSSAALIGSESTYVVIAPGCGGSLWPSALIPSDTPQIGRSMQVRLTNLPNGIAVMVFGLDGDVVGLPLTGLGMPGCTAHVVPLAPLLVAGAATEATVDLPFPMAMACIGIRFFNQALVLDSGANNALRAVVSEAAQGVIGG